MTFLEKILAIKVQEVAEMVPEKCQKKRQAPSFYQIVQEKPEQLHLIAEVKRASPSKGAIRLEVDVVAQAKGYEEAGAAAISVLTDPAYFKGSIADLRKVANSVSLPVLCKDFIIDQKQLIRARNAGATIILLIVAALSTEKLFKLYQKATELELEVLVEVHDAQELRIAEKLGAKIIGVNNRNLHSFEVNIAVSEELAAQRKEKSAIYISESGFGTAADVNRIRGSYQGVLIGEALMRAENPEVFIKEIKEKKQ